MIWNILKPGNKIYILSSIRMRYWEKTFILGEEGEGVYILILQLIKYQIIYIYKIVLSVIQV